MAKKPAYRDGAALGSGTALPPGHLAIPQAQVAAEGIWSCPGEDLLRPEENIGDHIYSPWEDRILFWVLSV